MKIIHETATHQIVRYDNQMQALGLAATLGTLTRIYGADPLFNFVERTGAYIQQQQLVFLQSKGAPDAPLAVPVGFIAWAYLSPPIEIIFAERFRPLQPSELKSGKRLWLMEICAPMGGADVLLDWLAMTNPEHATFSATWANAGKLTKKVHNLAKRRKETK